MYSCWILLHAELGLLRDFGIKIVYALCHWSVFLIYGIQCSLTNPNRVIGLVKHVDDLDSEQC